MKISDLEIFIAVVEEHKITKAAKRLAMTQPGVSQHIAKLEDELGRQLFDRVKKRLRLNDYGRIFLEKARSALKEFEHLKDFSTQQVQPTGTLKLGLTDSSTETLIPPSLKLFRESYPAVHLEIIVSESEEIEDGVLRGKYDLGVISGSEISHPLLEEHIIGADRIDCLVSKSHPISKFKRVSLKRLVEWPLIIYPKKSRTRKIVDEAFRENGLLPREVLDVWYNSAAVRLAEAGLGIALLSRYFIENELIKHKCNHVRITGDPFKRNICVVRKKDARLSDPAYQFYKLLLKK